jgi:hypothetical protein
MIHSMADINDIIRRLEQQREGIDRALEALRAVGGGAVSAPARRGPGRPKKTATAAAPAPVKAKRRLSPEGRARIIAALKKRWADAKKG